MTGVLHPLPAPIYIMDLMWLIFLTIAVYSFFVFVVLRLVAPFLGFRQYHLPHEIPVEIRQAIARLESRASGRESFLQAVYTFILEKNSVQWRHTRLSAAMRLPRLFVSDLSEIWNTRDFVYCTGINFVVYVMLANSKYFTVGDIRLKHTFANMVLHQYLKVKVGQKWVDVDPAGTGIRGKPLGTHLAGFG